MLNFGFPNQNVYSSQIFINVLLILSENKNHIWLYGNNFSFKFRLFKIFSKYCFCAPRLQHKDWQNQECPPTLGFLLGKHLNCSFGDHAASNPTQAWCCSFHGLLFGAWKPTRQITHLHVESPLHPAKSWWLKAIVSECFLDIVWPTFIKLNWRFHVNAFPCSFLLSLLPTPVRTLSCPFPESLLPQGIAWDSLSAFLAQGNSWPPLSPLATEVSLLVGLGQSEIIATRENEWAS